MKKLILGALASLAFTATAAAQVSAQANANVNVTSALTITKSTDLNFGDVIKPTTGSGTVSITAADGVRNTGGGAVASGTSSAASFNLSGSGGLAYSATVPTTATLTRIGQGGNQPTLSATLTSVGTTGNLSGSAGTIGSATINVGGTLTVPSTTTEGAYTGVFTVTANYN